MNKYLEKIAFGLKLNQSVLKGVTKPMTLEKSVVRKQPNPFHSETINRITSGIAKRKGFKEGL